MLFSYNNIFSKPSRKKKLKLLMKPLKSSVITHVTDIAIGEKSCQTCKLSDLTLKTTLLINDILTHQLHKKYIIQRCFQGKITCE